MSPQEILPPATPGASAVAVIECPACGTQNTTDSKFCRQCGHLLRPIPGLGSDAKKAAPAEGAKLEDDEDLTSPAEIDARRALQLLDRALMMSERGDLNAALLACRQAISLDHNHSESYALLGTLLERNGDLRGAMSAYEHVLELAPDNELERDSLNRIKARLEKAPAFSFNPNDLFGADEEMLPSVATPEDEVTEVVPQEDLAAIAPERDEHGIEARLPPTSATLRAEAPAPVASTPEATPVVAPVAPLVFDFDPAPETALPSVSPLAAAMDGETVARVGAAIPPSPKPAPSVSTPPPASGTGSMPKIERRKAQRRQVSIPVATERRMVKDRRASATVAGATFAPTPSVWPARPGSLTPQPVNPVTIAPLDFSFGTTPPTPTPLWAQMMRGSSFFMRTLPLIVVGVLGLGFLSWARSQAVAHNTNVTTNNPAVVDTSGTTTTTGFQPAPQTQNNVPTGTTFGATPAPGSNSGFQITNATPIPVTANTTSNPNVPANTNRGTADALRPAAGAQGSGNGANGRSNAGTPPFPVPIAPAPVPPASTGNTGGNTGNNSGSGTPIVLPPPQTPNTGGNAEPPVRVGSLGTNPLNPGGSPQEGRIRITQGSLTTRPAPPPRTGTQATGAERAANAASASGNSDRAINNLTSAINSTGNDQGFLLQQRAMAFMDRGDYARAVEDFQAAIGAYQEQINSGNNVASAQAGLRSARSGLNLALSRR
ncbi:hypothetical protein IAD21_03226 [Abditibacteriota bacterium]|nr:hypothetical protein IAD21_03226 [Abditibacteriota bacterium]